MQSSSAFAATSNNELKYFNARGAAETIRLLLAYADQKYTDTRYDIIFEDGKMSTPTFNTAKENGELVMNLNRAPILITKEGTIGQSKAIERFLAKQFNLMGSSDFEAAQIDCVAEHCRDVKDACQRKGFSAFSRNKTEEEKAVARKEWFETDMPGMLEKIEKALEHSSKKDGYAVGESTSYADIVIFALLKDCAASDLEDTKNASKNCKILNSVAERIQSNDKIRKWLDTRPVTNF